MNHLFKIERTDLVEAGEERTAFVRAETRERALELAVAGFRGQTWFLEDGSNTTVTLIDPQGEEGVLAVEYAEGSDLPHAVKVTWEDVHKDSLYGRYATEEEAIEVLKGLLAEVRAGTTDVQTVRLAHSEGRGSWGLGEEFDVRKFRVDIRRANGATSSSEHEGDHVAWSAMHREIDKKHRKDPEGQKVVYAERFLIRPGKEPKPMPGKFLAETSAPRQAVNA